VKELQYGLNSIKFCVKNYRPRKVNIRRAVSFFVSHNLKPYYSIDFRRREKDFKTDLSALMLEVQLSEQRKTLVSLRRGFVSFSLAGHRSIRDRIVLMFLFLMKQSLASTIFNEIAKACHIPRPPLPYGFKDSLLFVIYILSISHMSFVLS